MMIRELETELKNLDEFLRTNDRRRHSPTYMKFKLTKRRVQREIEEARKSEGRSGQRPCSKMAFGFPAR